MSTATRRSLQTSEQPRKEVNSNSNSQRNRVADDWPGRVGASPAAGRRARVFVAAENRLLKEALSRMLSKSEEVDVIGAEVADRFRAEDLLKEEADILLLSSSGNRQEDLTAIRSVRSGAPNVAILLIGVTGEEAEFLQFIRAGVRGYLPRDASAEDVMEGVRAVQMGKAVCPGTLCAALFRYFEQEATSFPSASVHQRLGLTRREQQLIPLIAEGLTNKEIANRFCLSEQTIKNHLYRMKRKIGA